MSFAKILPLLIAAAPVALATPALAQSAAPTGPLRPAIMRSR